MKGALAMVALCIAACASVGPVVRGPRTVRLLAEECSALIPFPEEIERRIGPGDVLVSVRLWASGAVRRVEIVGSDMDQTSNERVLVALQDRCRYEPELDASGRAINSIMYAVVGFRDGRRTALVEQLPDAHILPEPTEPCGRHVVYPPEAVQRGVEGPVRLRASIRTDGTAKVVEVVRRTDDALTAAAIDAMEHRCKWRPAVDFHGVAIPFVVPYTFRFVLPY